MLELPSDPFNFLEEEAMNGVCHLFIFKSQLQKCSKLQV